MACEAVLLQRQGDDVGRLVRGLRSVDSAQGISAASGDNRAGGGRTPWSGFSVSIQHFRAVRHAVADVYERCDKQRQPVWKQRLLDGKSARDVYGARGVSGLRQADWQPFGGIPEMGEASHCGCVLRRHGAEPGAIQTDERADPYDHRTLRRRSAWCAHMLQAAHAVWNRRSQSETFFDHRAMGPSGYAHTESGSRRTEIWPGEPGRLEQVAHRMVRLGDEKRNQARISEEARGVLRGGSRGVEVRGQSREHLERDEDAVSRFRWRRW